MISRVFGNKQVISQPAWRIHITPLSLILILNFAADSRNNNKFILGYTTRMCIDTYIKMILCQR